METIKKVLGVLPTGVWIVLGLFLLVATFWFSDDIGSWWEGRKQTQFDKKISEKQIVIDNLIKQRDEAITKAKEAEIREQTKIVESDLLRQEAVKRGVNIDEAQKKIDASLNEFKQDTDFIDKYKTGEVSSLQLCQKQCQDSGEQGFPCRPNYCDKFK